MKCLILQSHFRVSIGTNLLKQSISEEEVLACRSDFWCDQSKATWALQKAVDVFHRESHCARFLHQRKDFT